MSIFYVYNKYKIKRRFQQVTFDVIVAVVVHVTVVGSFPARENVTYVTYVTYDKCYKCY